MHKVDDRGRLEAIRDRLRAGGKRWTIAKGAVVESLLSHGGHMPALQVHDAVAARFPQVDRSTVQRVLLALEAERVVHVLGKHGEPRYGLADRPHHHAVCAVCGKVTELPTDLIQRFINEISVEVGFRFDRDSITLTGRCRRCTRR